MTIEKAEIQSLFVEPLMRIKLVDVISDKQIAFIKNLKMLKNQANLISENLYIFEEPELKSIKTAVQEALNLYAKEVMGIRQKLVVTQSWALLNHTNIGMHGHSHSNSVISGSLYYTDMPKPSAKMIFDRHNTYQLLQLNPEDNRQNLYNAPLNSIEPEANELLLFSSSLQHHVEANTSSQPRYSIAFNTFVRGKIGSFRDVSELNL